MWQRTAGTALREPTAYPTVAMAKSVEQMPQMIKSAMDRLIIRAFMLVLSVLKAEKFHDN